MKKRILLLSLTISLCAMVLITLFSTMIFYSNLVDNSSKHLSVYMLSYKENSSKFLPYSDQSARLLSKEVGDCRVTFIDESGKVLGDSHVAASQMENHLERKEVRDALAVGVGTAVRSSETLKENLIYYCQLFEQPSVEGYPKILVRIAETNSSLWAVLLQMLPLILIFAALDIALCFALSNFAVRHVLKPVEKFGQQALENKNMTITAPYKELESLAIILTQYKREQQTGLEEMKAERMRETVILENMEHGIVILKGIDDIILINKAAAKLLNYSEGDRVLLRLARDRELLDAVEGNKNILTYRKWRGHEYAYRTAYVREMDAVVVLITDVTAVRRAENTKNEFIANVTHEMNTPLTAISGFAELIASGKLTPAQCEKNAQIILEQSFRLTSLIKSILSYSAILGEEVPAENFSLTTLISGIASEYSAAAQSADIKITLEAAEDYFISAKSKHVKEVAENLCSNAIRYNRPGGSVTLKIDRDNSRVRLSVIDTGKGIAKDNFERVFDRFFTEDTSHSKGGFGLGLAIVKKLAAANGWDIKLSSKLGEGTTISVTF